MVSQFCQLHDSLSKPPNTRLVFRQGQDRVQIELSAEFREVGS